MRVFALSLLLVAAVAYGEKPTECANAGEPTVSAALLQTRKTQPAKATLVQHTCQDLHEDCMDWREEDIGCESYLFDNNNTQLKHLCPAMCGACGETAASLTQKESACQDISDDCLDWRENDVGCDEDLFANGTLMRQLCPSMCGGCRPGANLASTCAELSEDCQDWQDSEEVDCEDVLFENGTRMRDLCPRMCGACGGGV